MKLIASAGSLAGLESLLKEYFYSPSVRIVGDSVFNSKGPLEGRVVKKGARFRFERGEK